MSPKSALYEALPYPVYKNVDSSSGISVILNWMVANGLAKLKSRQTFVTEASSRNVRAFWKVDGDSSRVNLRLLE